MKTKIKILFSVISSVIIFSGAVVDSALALSVKNLKQNKIFKISQKNNLTNNQLAASSSNNKMADYQAKEYDLIKNVPIDQMNLLGSHDSGMYTTQGSLGNDVHGIPKWLFNHGSSWQVKKLATMQTQNIYEQLENGVRYLDLRISNFENSNNFAINNIYTTHSVLGASIVSVINQVAQFIAANPNELIILDFNHWYAGNGDKIALQSAVANYIWEAFGNTSSNLINKYNPKLKGSHLATSASKYNFNQPFSNFIKLNSPINKNIIVTFGDQWIYRNYIQNSYNSGNFSNLSDDVQFGQSNIISYWTQKYHWESINLALDQLKNLQNQYPNNIYVKQAIPNWDGFQYFSGYCQGKYGYQMDYWWNIRRHVLEYIESQDGYGGVILVDNAGTTKTLENWIYMNPAYGNEYNKDAAWSIKFNQPENFYYAKYFDIENFAHLANLLDNNAWFNLTLNGINVAYPGRIIIDKYLNKTHQVEFHFDYLNKYQTKEFIINDIYKRSIENVKFIPTTDLNSWITWNYHNWLNEYGKNATMEQFNIFAKEKPWEFYKITVNGKQIARQAYTNFIKWIKLIWIGNNNQYNIQVWTKPNISLNQSQIVYYNGESGGSIFTDVEHAYINISDYRRQISTIKREFELINSSNLNYCSFNQDLINKGLELAKEQKNYLLEFSKNLNFQNQVVILWNQINDKYNWILKYSSWSWNASILYSEFQTLVNQMINLYDQQIKINSLNSSLNNINFNNTNWCGINDKYIIQAKKLSQSENNFINNFSKDEKIKSQANNLWNQINNKYEWMLKYQSWSWNASWIYNTFKQLVQQIQILYNQTLN